MDWFSVLKNQVASTKGKTFQLDFNQPMVEEDDEDCFKYFYDLVKLMHPDFELKRQNYPDNIQGEDYWCRIKDTPWRVVSLSPGFHALGIGHDVIEEDYAEVEVFYNKEGHPDYPDKYISIVIPETPEEVIQRFLIFNATEEETLTETKNIKVVDNIEEIWKKMQQHMRSL